MAFLALILGALTAIAAAPAAVTVRAAGDCPSAAAVRERLDKLLGTPVDGRAPDLAEVDVVGATLSISLRRPSGEIVGEKQLAAATGCAARAESAAIVLAAWEAQLGDHAAAELVSPLAPPPIADAGPTTATAAATTATAAPMTATATPVLPLSRPTPPTVVGSASAQATAAEPRRWVLSPGGSLLASIDRDDTALAATAEAALSRSGSPFAVGAGAMFVSSHTVSVSPGIGTWRRYGLLVDGRWRAHLSRLWLEARVGGALTVLTMSGSALAESGGGDAFDPGAVAGLRLGLPGGPAAPWVEVGATVWPRRQTLDVRGGGTADLPFMDVLLGVGFSLERWP
jgi:hypothetical protein